MINKFKSQYSEHRSIYELKDRIYLLRSLQINKGKDITWSLECKFIYEGWKTVRNLQSFGTKFANCLLALHSLLYWPIDNLPMSHNALGMEANIRVCLIHNSSSHSSLDCQGLGAPVLSGYIVFLQD